MKTVIKKIGINGEGIAYINKKPVFIEGALIDEEVEIDIVKSTNNYKIGKLKKVLKKSIDRTISPCSNKGCGACSLLHTNYLNQLNIKKMILEESLSKYAGLETDVLVYENENPLGYRNSLKLPFGYYRGELVTGLYAQNSNRFVRIDNCLIHEPLLEDIRKEVLKILNSYDLSLYDHKTKKGLRYLYLRHLDNSVQMCLVTGNDHLRKEIIDDLKKIKNLKSLYQCVNTAKNSVDIFTNKMIHLYGDKKISFKVEDLKISLSIKSFYQLNTNQAKNLYKKVIEKLDGNEELIVEAYCGVGVMSLLASEKAKEIVGIEYLPEAINNANNNAKVNKISNVSFKCGDAGEMIKKLFKHRHIDTLIVDPPRMGLLDNMIETLLKAKIDKIIYVSCNPATLAKNLNDLSRKYYVESIEAFDMFSATSHVESLTVLKRK